MVEEVASANIEAVEKVNRKKVEEAPDIQSANYYVKSAPKKGLKYLKTNDALVNIAADLIFVKTFDSQKYEDLLIYLNAYQKVYMYILAGRYYPKSYIATFLDLRENILEIMYQFYVVVPSSFKHIYGLDPYKQIEKNIHAFLKLSRLMIKILENYSRLDRKDEYFPTTNPMPFDQYREAEKRHILP